jgi:hypothetical protein
MEASSRGIREVGVIHCTVLQRGKEGMKGHHLVPMLFSQLSFHTLSHAFFDYICYYTGFKQYAGSGKDS